MMPGLNGFDVCKIIKENSHSREIPIIFLTAKIDIDAISQAFSLGAVDYITKPFHANELLARVRTHIELFHSAQQDVENIAHRPENIPSINLLLTEAAPKAKKVIESITTLINEESSLEATPERKHLLKLLADSRGSFALSLANIRAYLLSGNNDFKSKFESKWAINEARFNDLSPLTNLFNNQQNEAWSSYKKLRAEFAPLTTKMFDLRSGKDWNLANYWLGTKAAPKAKEIMTILENLSRSQSKLVELDQASLERDISKLKSTLVAGVIII